MMMHRAVRPAEATPLFAEVAASRLPVHAAILSPRAPRLLKALAARDITAIDATGCDLALMRREAPDLLVLDLDPGTVPARRMALLVAQLGWARRDLVIAASRRTAAVAQGFAIDLIFDNDADDDTLADTLATAPRCWPIPACAMSRRNRPAPLFCAVRRFAAPRSSPDPRHRYRTAEAGHPGRMARLLHWNSTRPRAPNAAKHMVEKVVSLFNNRQFQAPRKGCKQ